MAEAADREATGAGLRYRAIGQRRKAGQKLLRRDVRRGAARAFFCVLPTQPLIREAMLELGNVAADVRRLDIAGVDTIGRCRAGGKLELDQVHIGITALLIGREHLGLGAGRCLAIAFQRADLALRVTSSGSGRLEDMSLEEVEAFLIKKALARYNGNVSHAANALGLSRSALYRRLERYGL